MSKWQFWIDRGGTFTDIVAISPKGQWHVKKLLSVNPSKYPDAALAGIRELMGCQPEDPIPCHLIEQVRMGTTIATNALLERKGDRVALLTTEGYCDMLRIGYQHRPDLFALHINLPEHLYERVEAIQERVDTNGDVIVPCDLVHAKRVLEDIYQSGIRSIAIVLMHSYRYALHEEQLAALARDCGFTEVSMSSEVSPLMKIISRGDTTVLDAYLSPMLNRYVNFLREQLGDTPLYFMKSSGGLVHASLFRSKHSILSGPAGGVVGAVQTSLSAGFDRVIGFDMGGTSTDVSHFHERYEYQYDTEVSGIRLRLPMLAIHTIAAGGGSIVHYHQGRFQVGPESAGAQPGPACYRQGGPLTITDCNVLLGKIQPDYFPAIFGESGDQPLDADRVNALFLTLQKTINADLTDPLSKEDIAEGFIRVAVMYMVSAIKKISIQKGHDISSCVLSCFGGAAGQHACLVAETLGVEQVMIHQHASVLSAYGMGLADVTVQRERVVEQCLTQALCQDLESKFQALETLSLVDFAAQGMDESNVSLSRFVHVKYAGTNNAIPIEYQHDHVKVSEDFCERHQEKFGYVMSGEPVIVEMISIDGIGSFDLPEANADHPVSVDSDAQPETIQLYAQGAWHASPVYRMSQLAVGQCIQGPAIVLDDINTLIIEPHWEVTRTSACALMIKKSGQHSLAAVSLTEVDPILLEVFNHLTMSIAEQMGEALVNTAYSVNIKERRDFSCALFDEQGALIANAPHIPVHLGSMGESVKSIIATCHDQIKPGDVYMLNDPYHGGTHLPDITVVTPVFISDDKRPVFYVASRGHHADIGGITPGSMPAMSQTIDEEGVCIYNVQLVREGEFLLNEVTELFLSGPYPARKVERNITDLKAQIAANACGVKALLSVCDQFGLAVVRAYMTFIQENAKASVMALIPQLPTGSSRTVMDNGAEIVVKVTVSPSQDHITIDFTGSSSQLTTNFNAPKAVTRAVVLYVFRTLVNTPMPLNDGCLEPIDIVIPDDCFLNPKPPGAVVAGNVETSQAIVDTLLAALGVLANSQGTMNNVTFGNDHYQYYETICGGAGAGDGFDGADAVQTHMTNSLLTDPEVLEHRFPVRLRHFGVREGSGGRGRYHGGCGVVRELEFLAPMTINLLSERRLSPPKGLCGGGDAQCGMNEVIRHDGTVETLAGRDAVTVMPGDRIRIQTPGGGGFGSLDEPD